MKVISARVYNKKDGKYLRIEYEAEMGNQIYRVIIPKINLEQAIIEHNNNISYELDGETSHFVSCDFIPKVMPNKNNELFIIKTK